MFKKYTTKQDQERYKLLNANKEDGFGGCTHYDFANVETLKTLIQRGYLDPNEAQNDAPYVLEFIKFMEKYPEFEAHGYIVDNERDDRRISIEGVRGYPQSAEAAEAFEDMFHRADEFNVSEDEFYCWYD